MTRGQQKLQEMIHFAQRLATLSTCTRKQQGCVIFPPDFSAVHAIGYNGPPREQNNRSCEGKEGPAWDSCGCIHGEANAMAKLMGPWGSYHGLVMYTTTFPCRYCAGLIVNSKKITTVIWDEPYKDHLGGPILAAAGVSALGGARVLEHSELLFRSLWADITKRCACGM